MQDARILGWGLVPPLEHTRWRWSLSLWRWSLSLWRWSLPASVSRPQALELGPRVRLDLVLGQRREDAEDDHHDDLWLGISLAEFMDALVDLGEGDPMCALALG